MNPSYLMHYKKGKGNDIDIISLPIYYNLSYLKN